MTGYAYAALGLILLGCAAYAADKLYGDRIRHALAARRFRRDIELHEQHQALITRIQDEIAAAEQRLREHLEGGD